MSEKQLSEEEIEEFNSIINYLIEIVSESYEGDMDIRDLVEKELRKLKK